MKNNSIIWCLCTCNFKKKQRVSFEKEPKLKGICLENSIWYQLLQLACYGTTKAKHMCVLGSPSGCGECVQVTQLCIGCLYNTRQEQLCIYQAAWIHLQNNQLVGSRNAVRKNWSTKRTNRNHKMNRTRSGQKCVRNRNKRKRKKETQQQEHIQLELSKKQEQYIMYYQYQNRD